MGALTRKPPMDPEIVRMRRQLYRWWLPGIVLLLVASDVALAIMAHSVMWVAPTLAALGSLGFTRRYILGPLAKADTAAWREQRRYDPRRR